MKQNLIRDIVQEMLPYLNNAQNEKLQEVLQNIFAKYDVVDNGIQESKSEPDYVELFLSAKRIEGCSEKTLNYYKSTIDALISTLNKDVKHIETDDVRRYLTDYQAKKNSSKVTIDNIRRILSSFFSWLEDESYILKSPVRRIHKVKTSTIIKETYSDEELEQMRDNCNELRDLAIIDMLASTGMRIGEMVLLNRSDIDFEERECVVFGKGSKERVVYINDACADAINQYLIVRRTIAAIDKNALFLSNRRTRMSREAVHSMVKNSLRRAGLDADKYSSHKLRHTAATLMLQNGVDVRTLQELLGHDNLNTTQIYTHIDNSELRTAADANPLGSFNPNKK